MKKNMWETIWNRKSLESIDRKKSEFELFCDLKKVDGFDVSVENEERYYKAFYEDWLIMRDRMNEIANGNINSVYEVGCGSGVNLFLYQNHYKDVSCGGIDYSESLIEIAKKVVFGKDLVCGEAKELDAEKKYDLVLADSVFQYFPDIDYAENVLRKMIKKQKKQYTWENYMI